METGHYVLSLPNSEICQTFSNLLGLQILSHLTTHEPTRTQCDLYRISSTALIVADQMFTKILKCFIKLCPRLSEAFSFLLDVFDNGSCF